jgi:multisubunit Na+/H+ antiporter MnhG subunit
MQLETLEVIVTWIIGGVGFLMLAPIASYLIARGASLAYFRTKREYDLRHETRPYIPRKQ